MCWHANVGLQRSAEAVRRKDWLELTTLPMSLPPEYGSTNGDDRFRRTDEREVHDEPEKEAEHLVHKRALTFDVRGGLRLGARRPLDGGVRHRIGKRLFPVRDGREAVAFGHFSISTHDSKSSRPKKSPLSTWMTSWSVCSDRKALTSGRTSSYSQELSGSRGGFQ